MEIIAAILEVGSDTKGPEDRLCLAHARTSVSWQAQYREDSDALGVGGQSATTFTGVGAARFLKGQARITIELNH